MGNAVNALAIAQVKCAKFFQLFENMNFEQNEWEMVKCGKGNEREKMSESEK